jgi:hypothetical protein
MAYSNPLKRDAPKPPVIARPGPRRANVVDGTLANYTVTTGGTHIVTVWPDGHAHTAVKFMAKAKAMPIDWTINDPPVGQPIRITNIGEQSPDTYMPQYYNTTWTKPTTTFVVDRNSAPVRLNFLPIHLVSTSHLQHSTAAPALTCRPQAFPTATFRSGKMVCGMLSNTNSMKKLWRRGRGGEGEGEEVGVTEINAHHRAPARHCAPRKSKPIAERRAVSMQRTSRLHSDR